MSRPNDFERAYSAHRKTRAEIARSYTSTELALLSTWAAVRTYEDHALAEKELWLSLPREKAELMSRWISEFIEYENARAALPGQQASDYTVFFDAVEANIGYRVMLRLRRELAEAGEFDRQSLD